MSENAASVEKLDHHDGVETFNVKSTLPLDVQKQISRFDMLAEIVLGNLLSVDPASKIDELTSTRNIKTTNDE